MPTNKVRHTGRHFLQIPGPTPLPDRVLNAMSRQMLDHRGPEFAEFGSKLLASVKTLFKTSNPVFIYPSSGTGAWESGLVNTLSPGDRILIVETGQFAVLWRNMAEKIGLKPEVVPTDWRSGADPNAIEARLKKDKAHDIKAVCIVHNETSTGTRSLGGPGPQGDGRRAPSGAADGRYGLLARDDGLPPRRMGRRRRDLGLAEGPDVAAGAVVHGAESEGASPPARPPSCRAPTGRGTICSP